MIGVGKHVIRTEQGVTSQIKSEVWSPSEFLMLLQNHLENYSKIMIFYTCFVGLRMFPISKGREQYKYPFILHIEETLGLFFDMLVSIKR